MYICTFIHTYWHTYDTHSMYKHTMYCSHYTYDYSRGNLTKKIIFNPELYHEMGEYEYSSGNEGIKGVLYPFIWI